MVQLKLTSSVQQSKTYTFQFHNGTIKTHLQLEVLFGNRYFNSIMVQLKRTSPNFSGVTMLLFQFHNSTIKTKWIQAKEIKDISFQFHNGTIKTDILTDNPILEKISIP